MLECRLGHLPEGSSGRGRDYPCPPPGRCSARFVREAMVTCRRGLLTVAAGMGHGYRAAVPFGWLLPDGRYVPLRRLLPDATWRNVSQWIEQRLGLKYFCLPKRVLPILPFVEWWQLSSGLLIRLTFVGSDFESTLKLCYLGGEKLPAAQVAALNV